MIQEYRKATAEALGFKKSKDKYYSELNHAFILVSDWQPDKDANQMLMVLDLLRDKAASLEAWSQWYYDEIDLKLATMQAYHKYLKTNIITPCEPHT